MNNSFTNRHNKSVAAQRVEFKREDLEIINTDTL